MSFFIIFITAVTAVFLPFTAIEAHASPSVSAYAAAVIEAESGRVIYSKNGDKRLPMASTTKIMTAATVIMLERDTERKITVSESAASVEGSKMGVAAGEEITLKSLLYGLMLSSGNDAATAIYEAFCGEALVDIMNIIAKEHLELKNTNFINTHGLPAKEHYSSACDMAAIMRFALNFGDFCKITSTKEESVSSGERRLYLKNHNRLLSEYEWCDGGKTGYTEAAGRCLVTTAEKNGVRLICVTLNAPDDWQDHTRLYEWAFSGLLGKTVSFEKGSFSVSVTGGEKRSVKASSDRLILPVFEWESIETRVDIPSFLYAPVNAGDCIGKIDYYSGDTLVASMPIYAEETVKREKEKGRLLEAFLNILL